MTAIRERGGTPAEVLLASFGYDAMKPAGQLGLRTSIARGNGTSASYAYDPLLRLETLTESLAGTGHDLEATFAYNPAGQIVSTGRSDAYAWTPPAGTNASPVNALNQMTQLGSAQIGYDARGNLTSDGSRSFSYTSENLLRSMTSGGATTPAASSPPTPTMNTASRPRATSVGSNIPARRGCRSWACTITRPESTRRRWGGFADGSDRVRRRNEHVRLCGRTDDRIVE
jgi:hypothetical protein